MRGYYYYTGDRLPIDDPKIDYETAQRQMQRLLADKISNFAPIEELRLLLVSGSKADGQVTLGLRPLHYACYRNYFDAAKLLIVRGAKVDCIDDIGYSPLHLCAEKGNFRMLELLLQHLVNRTHCVSFESKGQPYPIRDGADEPLRLAILQNHYECAKLLLECGANPNIRYFDGPQLTLIDPKELPYIRLLLEFKADPNIPARNGMTVLMKACEIGISAYKTIELLLQHKADPNEINFKTTYPMSCLHYAVGSGHVAVVRLLLNNGAQVNIRDRVLGKTQSNSFPSVLHFAIMSGNIEMVTLLIESGADLNISDSVYGNALHLCACYRIGTENQVEMVKLLLEHGSDPNASVVNSNGATLRSPVTEFFRRLYKFSVESDRPTEWTKIAGLLFSFGANFYITAENIEVSGMSITQTERVRPSYVDSLNYFIMRIAKRAGEDLETAENDNSIYATKEELMQFKHNPRSLQELTRNYIRSTIKVCPETIERLPLPFFAKDYLLGIAELPDF